MAIPGAIAALAVMGIAVLAYYAVLGSSRRVRPLVVMAVGIAVPLSPLLVPAARPFGRTLVAIAAVKVLVTLYDWHVSQANAPTRPRLTAYLGSLFNIFHLVVRVQPPESRRSKRENLVQLAWSSLVLGLGVLLFVRVFRADWTPWPFFTEHIIKVLVLYAVLLPLSSAGAAALRLAGGPALDFMRHPFAARTPAEFWRRYNRPAQQFFYEDIFKLNRGLRAPARAMLLVFAVSAAVHEYIFTIAIGQLQGYQTAFFLIQGCAVALTWRLRPKGSAAIVGIALTLAFVLATSVLFFASMGQVAPFYATRSHG